MPRFDKRLSKRLGRSRSNSSLPHVPSVSTTPTKTEDGEDGSDTPQLPEASDLPDITDSTPLPVTSASRFSSTPPFRKPKWARLRLSSLPLPAARTPEPERTASSAFTNPSTDHHPSIQSKEASPSSASQASTLTELPDVGPSLTSNIPLNGKPPWDRTVEILWTRRPSLPEESDRADEAAFRENLKRISRGSVVPILDPPPGSERKVTELSCLEQSGQVNTNQAKDTLQILSKSRLQNANSHYFQLPDAIRFKITKHIVQSHNPHNKPIRMNDPYFLHDVWPVNRLAKPKEWSTDYFESLESVLSSLSTYTSVCSAMCADVLATLFLTRHFHVVYALGVTRTLQPAATEYMDRYGPLMASITLEVDFTKLGGSWKPEATKLDALAGLRGVRGLVKRFVDRQLVGRQGTAIRDLRVLVKRYYGYRPMSAGSSPSETPYTPDEHISHVLDPLKRLGSQVDALMLSGTSKAFAMELVASLRDSKSGSNSDPDSNTHDEKSQQGEAQDVQYKKTEDIQYRLPARQWPLVFPGSDQGCVVDCSPDRGGVRLITWDDRAGLDREVAGCHRWLANLDQGRAGEGEVIGNKASDGNENGSRMEMPKSGGGHDPRLKGLRSEGRGLRLIRSFSRPSVEWPRLLGRLSIEYKAASGGEVEDRKERRERNGEEVGEGREQKSRFAHRVLERAVSGGAKGLFGYY